MPFAFGCPHCGSRLKTPTPVPAGRSVQCPKCNDTFTVGTDDVEEVPSSSRDAAPPPASRTPRRRDEEEEERPRSRRRDEEEEERPRSRRRDEEEEERPRPRRRDEEEEERPRSRRGGSSYDDYDDRPRSKKKKGGTGMMIFWIILALLLIGGLVWLLIWLFSGSKNFDKEMLSYLPANTVMVGSMDVESLMKLDTTEEMLKNPELKKGLDELKKLGIKPDDVSRIVVGMGNLGPGKEPSAVLVVRFKKSFSNDRFVKELKGEKKQKKGETYYKEANGDECYYFPTDQLLVLANRESVLTDKIFDHDGTIRFSDELEDMCKSIQKNQFWVAMTISKDLRKEMEITPQMRQQVGKMMPKAVDLLDSVPNLTGVAMFANDDGTESKLGVGVKLKDGKEAEKFAENAKQVVISGVDLMLVGLANLGGNFPDDARKFVTDTAGKTKSERIGEMGFVIITVNDKEYLKLYEKYKNKLEEMGNGAQAPMQKMPIAGKADPAPPFKK